MIEITVARNPYDSSDRSIERVSWVQFGVVGDYFPEELAGKGLACYLDGVRCDETEPVGEDSRIGFVVLPGWAQVGAALVNVLVATAVSYTFSLFFGRPAKPVDGEETSATYAWSGTRQNDRQGSPIAITPGKMRVGGTVIGEYVEAQATPPKNVLFQLVALGEGPFESIAGITADTKNGAPVGSQDGAARVADEVFIDDERAGNLRDVTLHARMGTQEQDAIEWFKSVRNEHAIGRTITSVETTNAVNSALSHDPLHWYDGGNSDLWDEHGVGYTFDEVMDECAVRIRFPRGMFRQGGSGIAGSFIGIQIRYRELDAIGLQVKSGGMNGDGWVYLPPVLPFPVEQRDAFEFQERFEFRDKDQYTPPGDGSCFDTLANIAGVATINAAPGGPANGNAAPAFSASTWIKIPALAASGATFRHLFGDYDQATSCGWAVGLDLLTDIHAGTDFWALAIEWGNGSSKVTYRVTVANDDFYEFPMDEWAHVAISYDPAQRLHLYVNGVEWIEERNASAMQWGGSLHLGRNPEGAHTDAIDMQVDDFLLWDVAMQPDHLAEQVATGKGRFGTGYTDALRCWIHWEPPTGLTQKASDPWFLDATLSGGAAIVAGVGVLPEPVTGPLKPGRYHVEVARINERSTAPETVDLSEVASFTAIRNVEHAYPGIPLLALRVEATDQLSSSMPPTSVIVEGRRWPVWDGQSTANPAISALYTKNPAWICYGILTNAKIGLGRHFGLDDVDLVELKAWADHCDEVLTDGSAPLAFDPVVAASDLRFHSFEADPETAQVRGAFEIVMPKTVHGELPVTWGPDSRILLQGLPTPADEPGKIHTDPNGGYRIYKIEDDVAGNAWKVWCWWDRTHQTDPWTGGDLLGADILTGILGSLYPGALVQGGIPRFEFNGSFDTHGSAWEAIISVAATARAAPIPSGNKVRFRWSAPRPVTALIGRGSIIPGSFKMTIGGGTDDTNAYDYTFMDQTRSYERSAEEIFDTTIVDPEDASQTVKRSTDLFGVTHPKQAERQFTYDLRARRMLKRRGTFDLATDGLAIEPGDVVQLSHDVLPRGLSGRLIGNGSLTQVQLDQPVTFEAGKTYKLRLQNVGQNFQESEVDVAAMGGPGTYEHGTTIELVGLTSLPLNQNPYILTASGEELTIEIGSVRLSQDMTRSVEFIEYNPDIFTDL